MREVHTIAIAGIVELAEVAGIPAGPVGRPGTGDIAEQCHVVEEREPAVEPVDLVRPVAKQRHRAVREDATDGAPTQDVPLDPGER